MRRKEILKTAALGGLFNAVKGLAPNLKGVTNTLRGIVKPNNLVSSRIGLTTGLNSAKPGTNFSSKINNLKSTYTNFGQRVGAGMVAHGGAVGGHIMQDPLKFMGDVLGP